MPVAGCRWQTLPEESRGQVDKLLMSDREIEALDHWLAMARASSKIDYRGPAFQ